jgi:NitT/TauT family transport system substrate-binding protein
MKLRSIRRVTSLLLASTLALSVSACGDSDDESGGATDACPDGVQGAKFINNWDGTAPQDLALWVALDKGYFEEECLKVDYEFGKGSVQVAQLVSSGQFDFGNMSAASLVQTAATTDTNLVSVAVDMPKDLNSWVYYEDSGIKEPKDLEGKKLGTTAESSMITLLPALGEAAGFDADKVEVVAVDVAARIALLMDGKLDATSLGLGETANETLAEKGPIGRVLLSDYLPLIGYSIVATRETVDDHSDKTARFVRAMAKAWRDIISDPESAIGIAAEYLQDKVTAPPAVDLIEKATVPAMPALMTYESPDRPGWTSEQQWGKMIDTLVEAQGLPKSPEVTDIMTNEFVTENLGS